MNIVQAEFDSHLGAGINFFSSTTNALKNLGGKEKFYPSAAEAYLASQLPLTGPGTARRRE